jgi:serine/threonine-protein kinase
LELREQIQSALGSAYGVERELGGGGMSRVFVATETALGRRIVVKTLPPDAMGGLSIDRFKREIRLAATLQHPHIVPLLAAGDIDGLPYYTMPFVKGESLRERLVKGGELSVGDTLHVLRDVASALAYAHGEGVVHRDIKPDNIILSGGVAVVTDFGVAKALDVAGQDADKHTLTSLGIALGTPAYMSPEQASADPQVDHRADLYSFGCVAYEMLAGSSPFAGRPAPQTLAAQVQEQPESIAKRRPAVPPALAALIMSCLEKRPGDRPQSASEVLAALDAIGTPTGGSQPTGARLSGVNATGRAGRRGLLIAGGVMLVSRGDRRCDVLRSQRHDTRRATRAGHARRHDVGVGDRPGDLSRRQVRRVHVRHARQLSYSCSTDRRRALRGRERLDQRRAFATQLVARRIADRIRREQRRVRGCRDGWFAQTARDDADSGHHRRRVVAGRIAPRVCERGRGFREADRRRRCSPIGSGRNAALARVVAERHKVGIRRRHTTEAR